MVDRVKRGRIVSDTGPQERQQLLAERSAMLLAVFGADRTPCRGCLPMSMDAVTVTNGKETPCMDSTCN